MEPLTSLDSLIPIPLVRRQHIGDISYTSPLIADFFLNFIVMATWVGCDRTDPGCNGYEIWDKIGNSSLKYKVYVENYVGKLVCY